MVAIRQRIRRCFLGAFVVLSLAFCMGCNPGNIGTVTGTVKLDGKPLPKAMLTFYPRHEGRASKALTDENGQYELIYTRDINGAEVGQHMIQITTAVEGGDYDDGGDYGGSKIAKELIPSKYNIGSELLKDVEPGSNVIDFDLDSKGEIVQSAY